MNHRLKELRLDLNKTQREIADELSVNQSYYSDVENYKRPLTKRFMTKVAKAYSVNTDWLVGNSAIKSAINNLEGRNQSTDHDTLNNKAVAGMLAILNKDPLYTYSKTLSINLLVEHGKQLAPLISALNQYWDAVRLSMQFVHQYDAYLLNNTGLQVYHKAKDEGLTPEELANRVNSIFANVESITPLIKNMADQLIAGIDKLRPYDVEKTLERNDWVKAKEHLQAQEFEYMPHYDSIFNIVEKEYPEM